MQLLLIVPRLFSCKRLDKSFWNGYVKESFSSYLCEIKVILLLQDKRNSKPKKSLPFGILSPLLYIVYMHYPSPDLPMGRTTCSSVESNIFSASARHSLEDSIPSWACKKLTRPTTMWLWGSGLCKLSLIMLFDVTPLCLKRTSQSFLRCSSQAKILEFGSSKISHFFLRLTD